MKRVLKLSILLFGATLFFVSCEKDLEADADVNYRDEFLGVWTAVENGDVNGVQSYQINISAGSAEDEIIFNGIYNLNNVKVTAFVTGFNVSIPKQTIQGITFTGSGQAVANFDNININFTANDGSGDDNVSVQLTR